ncbi:YfiT family bacillithiol transferase [Pararhodonellum marinum]|uniref:YfiT family bacillithiol transferase n=1 Tax=Pararhodonellum marinum TaxID=2755358 RepID=UPI00188DF96D|nr:putative metal-dependent hydrolase [Pararhodonellum marinum]
MTINLQYPIGRFSPPQDLTAGLIEEYIQVIASFPSLLRKEVQHMAGENLHTPYRPGGWTVKQVIHHCADSHMNSFIRFKLALTEDNPTIKEYSEGQWAELTDGQHSSVESSLKLLEGLHERWVALLKSLNKEELKRTFFHPEKQKSITLEHNVALYAWHCQHHLTHVRLVSRGV